MQSDIAAVLTALLPPQVTLLQSDISAVLTALLSPQVTLLQSYIAAFLTALLSPQVTLLQSDRAAVPTVLLSPLSIPGGLAGGFPGPRVVDGLHLNRRELAARCNLVEDGLTRNEVALVEGVLVQKHRCHEWKRLVRSVDVRKVVIVGILAIVTSGDQCQRYSSGPAVSTATAVPSAATPGQGAATDYTSPAPFRWDQPSPAPFGGIRVLGTAGTVDKAGTRAIRLDCAATPRGRSPPPNASGIAVDQCQRYSGGPAVSTATAVPSTASGARTYACGLRA